MRYISSFVRSLSEFKHVIPILFLINNDKGRITVTFRNTICVRQPKMSTKVAEVCL
jgi:hypothetical protein